MCMCTRKCTMCICVCTFWYSIYICIFTCKFTWCVCVHVNLPCAYVYRVAKTHRKNLPLSCRSFSTKEPLNIGHFCGKWPIKMRDPMSLCHPVCIFGYWICVRLFTCKSTWCGKFTRECLFICVCIYVYLCVFMCICIYSFTCVCICVCKFMCIHVYVYVYVNLCVKAHDDACIEKVRSIIISHIARWLYKIKNICTLTVEKNIYYGVATVRRIDKIIGFFCRI